MAQISQSEKIRRMFAKGQSAGAIAKKLGIRYQTVWRTTHRPYKGVVPAVAREAKELALQVEQPVEAE